MPFSGERLKFERERLGFGQAELAEACAVTPRSQRNYESGERMPDAAYLSMAIVAGVDVIYVLTGDRASTSSLTRDEQELLALYQSATLAGKAAAIGALQGVASSESGKQVKKIVVRGGQRIAGRDYLEYSDKKDDDGRKGKR